MSKEPTKYIMKGKHEESSTAAGLL